MHEARTGHDDRVSSQAHEMSHEVSSERAERARRTFDVLFASPEGLQSAGATDVFETFFEQARVGLALADLSGRLVRVNPTYAELLGSEPEDLVGRHVADLVHPEDRERTVRRLDAVARGQLSSSLEEDRVVPVHSPLLWLQHGVGVVPGADGDPAWLALSAQDITERRRVERDLRALTASLTEAAVRDPLTGLANRSLFEERLRAVLARDERTGQSTAVLFLDLDGFKQVNDEHGHAVGDAVLRAVATRLSGAVRPSDTVARLGGDEFVVLVEGAGQDAVGALVERLHHVVAEPIAHPTGQRPLSVGVSIGVAFSQRGTTPAQRLLSEADKAMYVEKQADGHLGRPAREHQREAGREEEQHPGHGEDGA